MGFFAVIVSVWLLMQGYMVVRLWRSFPRLGRWRWAFVGWGLVTLGALFAEIHARRSDAGPFLQMTGQAFYVWLVVLVWFFLFGLAMDLWSGLAWVVSLYWKPARRVIVPRKPGTIVLLVLIAGGVVWGLIESGTVREEDVTIQMALGEGPGRPIRIVQVSDWHITSRTSAESVGEIVDRVNALEPDLIVATGDMMDSPARLIAAHAAELRRLHAPLGKFAVIGNHEAYTGLDEAADFHSDAGFELLRGRAIEATRGLWLVGVDDPAVRWRAKQELVAESDAIAQAGPGAVLLLKHQPDATEAAARRVRLQLSGHTHGGQFLPWHVFVWLRYRRLDGLYDVGDMQVYVNRGTGTWGPPIRVGAPPEITVITLQPATP